MAAAGQVFEALLVDNTPDPERPGFLRLKIPDLSGGDPYPHLVGPMFAGWVAGGWQSIPAVKTPEGQPTRLLVHYGGDGTVRWFGTSQLMDIVGSSPGTMSAVRSGDGRHYMLIDSLHGIQMSVKQDGADLYSYLSISPSGNLQLQSASNTLLKLDSGFYLQTSQSHALSMGSGGVLMVHGAGGTFLNLAETSAHLQGEVVNIGGNAILLGTGQALPTHRYIKSNAFFTDLASALLSVVTALSTPGPLTGPVPLPTVASFASDLITSMTVGDPFLSTRIYGD